MNWAERRMWLDGLRREFAAPENQEAEDEDDPDTTRRVDNLSDLEGSGLTPRTG